MVMSYFFARLREESHGLERRVGRERGVTRERLGIMHQCSTSELLTRAALVHHDGKCHILDEDISPPPGQLVPGSVSKVLSKFVIRNKII